MPHTSHCAGGDLVSGSKVWNVSERSYNLAVNEAVVGPTDYLGGELARKIVEDLSNTWKARRVRSTVRREALVR